MNSNQLKLIYQSVQAFGIFFFDTLTFNKAGFIFQYYFDILGHRSYI